MERILVFSDTHGNIDKALQIFDTIIGVTGVIHLGDYVRDAERLENYIYPVPLYYVAGNNDFFTPYPMEKMIEIAGKKLFLCHGHQYVRFGDIDSLKEVCSEKKADIALFGHTHTAYYEKDKNVIYANPGSTTQPRFSDRAYGVIEIENGVIGYSNIFI